jgi:4-amino-4-deoxy-L-arabinose transferase-like glycosyltransferase
MPGMGTGLRGARGVLVVAAAVFLLGLPFLGALPLFDPDEGFYPAAAAESLDSGHPLDIRLNGGPRWQKPAGCYAAIQASFEAFGRSERTARLPTVLLLAATVFVVGASTARAAGPRAGVLAAIVLGSSFFPCALGRAAHPETGQVLGIAAAQAVLGLWFALPAAERPRGALLLAGLGMGFGFAWKSPTALAMPALAAAAAWALLRRDERPGAAATAGLVLGAAGIGTALAAPWFLWMTARHGTEFLGYAFDQLGHFTSGRFDHPGGPTYYLLPLVAGFVPWSGLLPFLPAALRRGGDARERWRLFSACAFATSFLYCTVSGSKLGSYALAFFPPLASLAGLLLDEAWTRASAGTRGRALSAPAVMALGTGVVLAAAAILGPSILDHAPAFDGLGRASWEGAAAPLRTMLLPAAAVLVAGGIAGLVAATPGVRIGGPAAAGALLVPVLLATAPAYDAATRPWSRFAARIEAAHAPGDPVVVHGMRLPSLTFALRRPVRWTERPKALAAALEGPGRPFLVVKEKWAHLAPAADHEVLDRAAGLVLLRRRAP